MNLDKLKDKYDELIREYDEVKAIHFVNHLIESSNEEILEFHYELLKNQENELLFYSIRGQFDRHKTSGKLFLLNKLDKEKDLTLKAEALFILGAFDDLKKDEVSMIRKDAMFFLNIRDSYKYQYYAIIVLGWIGKKDEVKILYNEMKANKDVELRGYAASALRQIWYENKRLGKEILRCYHKVLLDEEEYVVVSTIIVCIQDVLQKKMGIREDRYGKITGNIEKAKPKAIKALQKII